MISQYMISPYIGDPDSANVMRRADALKPELRALIHEYGFVIVAATLDQTNCRDADVIAIDLETWRERRQEQLLGGLACERRGRNE